MIIIMILMSTCYVMCAPFSNFPLTLSFTLENQVGETIPLFREEVVE